jgi:hypothetical protein
MHSCIHASIDPQHTLNKVRASPMQTMHSSTRWFKNNAQNNTDDVRPSYQSHAHNHTSVIEPISSPTKIQHKEATTTTTSLASSTATNYAPQPQPHGCCSCIAKFVGLQVHRLRQCHLVAHSHHNTRQSHITTTTMPCRILLVRTNAYLLLLH